jgi:(1->4)-alpha-D-glucan 1-alpha-D-glucosylmutase
LKNSARSANNSGFTPTEIQDETYMSADAKIPRATYRLQFNEHFRLSDALALVPYLHELGVSHIYASPLFKAVPHSVHGYDVCDFNQLNPEIGTETDLEKLVYALHEKKMGLILDIVPNHMGIASPENLWWRDVLKNGRASKFASHFDINWESEYPELCGKILVPILADDCETILQKGELKVKKQNGEFILNYFENQFPLALSSIPENLSLEQLNSNHIALDELIQRQNYRLASWRDGDSKLNYRRFFAVSTLAAIRVEDEKVFNDVHALLRKWIEHGWLDGLRVDHPDGLRDPENYLRRLRALAPDLWIVVEKILQPQEQLSETWPVQGTTGYDFLNQVNGLFIDSANEQILTSFYCEFIDEPTDSGKLIQEKKKLVLKTLFTAEVNRLTELLVEISARHLGYKKFPREQFRKALIEFAASLSVYRTYVQAGENLNCINDFHFIKQAAAKVKELRGDLAPELFDFLSSMLLLQFRGELESEFVARFQQLTSPVMAKGVEDTAFYCFNRFASLNEVGGDPGKFGVGAEEFHGFCHEQKGKWPHSMLASSTHDTKRSEDVRARLNLLSEIPDEWCATVLRWSNINACHRRGQWPDRNMEYLFYQTLAGAWPLPAGRVLAYMEKSAREAGQHTTWGVPDNCYENALWNFVVESLRDPEFIMDVGKVTARLADAALVNSLAQTLVKLTAPGVPDIYQGCELLDYSLVDPDNRRPIDFELSRQLLEEAKKISVEKIWERRGEGLPKIWLIHKTLKLRAQKKKLFDGDYEPLLARGKKAKHAVAFMRDGGLITIVPHLVLGLKNWGDTFMELPRGHWRNEFTGEKFVSSARLSELLNKFPVALLVGKEDG